MNAESTSVFPRPEWELLACCARKGMTPERREKIAAILQGETIDWAFALRKAQWHGLLPLLAKHVAEACADGVPPAVREDLQSRVQANARRNLSLAAELLKLLRAFAARGIPVVPFKGPVLALSLYGDVALRQFVDLDLFVRRADILAARNILVAHGLAPQFELSSRQELAYFEFRSEHAYSNPAKDLFVDLHCALTPRHFCAPLDFERFAGRLRPMPFGEMQVPAFSREDLLLILCVHGAKDFWERLIHVADVSEILRCAEPLGWNHIFAEAASAGATRMLRCGLILARDLLGAELPATAAAGAASDRGAQWLAAQATRRLLQEADTRPSFWRMQRFAFRAVAEPSAAAKYVAENIFTPTPLEWKLLPLPENVSFLYRVLRPLRLTGKHLRALLAPHSK